jgi:intracellular multiplication protein IcmE
MTEKTASNEVLGGKQDSLARSNIKNVFGGGIGRISLILFGVVLSLMAVYGGTKLFSKPNLPQETNPGSAVSNVAARKTDPMTPVSTEEGAKRAQANAETAAAAQANGKAFVAQPVVTDRQLDSVPGGQGAAVGTNVLAQPQPAPVVATPQVGGNVEVAPQQANAQPLPQESSQVDPDLKKKVMAQVESVMGSATGSPNSRGFQTYYAAALQNQGNVAGKLEQAPPAAGGGGYRPSGANVSPRAPEPIAATGDTCYATLDNGISTDDTTIVLATIHACSFPDGERFHQARVAGRIERAQDQVRVVFNKVRLVSSKSSLPIEAIAVTEDEARSGVGKDVDHHYFERYFSLGLSSLLSGYGRSAEAAARSGGTTVITAGSTTVQTPPITAKQQTAIALGEMGQAFASEIKRDFNRPTTVSAPRGMGLGVIFVNDVVPTK